MFPQHSDYDIMKDISGGGHECLRMVDVTHVGAILALDNNPFCEAFSRTRLFVTWYSIFRTSAPKLVINTCLAITAQCSGFPLKPKFFLPCFCGNLVALWFLQRKLLHFYQQKVLKNAENINFRVGSMVPNGHIRYHYD